MTTAMLPEPAAVVKEAVETDGQTSTREAVRAWGDSTAGVDVWTKPLAR